MYGVIIRKWWSEGDLNPRHADFQSAALPTELSDHTRVIKRRASFYRLIPFRSRGQVLFYEISPCNTHGTPNNTSAYCSVNGCVCRLKQPTSNTQDKTTNSKTSCNQMQTSYGISKRKRTNTQTRYSSYSRRTVYSNFAHPEPKSNSLSSSGRARRA